MATFKLPGSEVTVYNQDINKCNLEIGSWAICARIVQIDPKNPTWTVQGTLYRPGIWYLCYNPRSNRKKPTWTLYEESFFEDPSVLSHAVAVFYLKKSAMISVHFNKWTNHTQDVPIFVLNGNPKWLLRKYPEVNVWTGDKDGAIIHECRPNPYHRYPSYPVLLKQGRYTVNRRLALSEEISHDIFSKKKPISIWKEEAYFLLNFMANFSSNRQMLDVLKLMEMMGDKIFCLTHRYYNTNIFDTWQIVVKRHIMTNTILEFLHAVLFVVSNIGENLCKLTPQNPETIIALINYLQEAEDGARIANLWTKFGIELFRYVNLLVDNNVPNPWSPRVTNYASLERFCDAWETYRQAERTAYHQVLNTIRHQARAPDAQENDKLSNPFNMASYVPVPRTSGRDKDDNIF